MTTDLKLGLQLGYWASKPPEYDWVGLVKYAEDLGFDSVWTAESWGSDAFTPARLDRRQHHHASAWAPAIVQLSARTPTATAMHAMTMDHLSGGRFILGLGAVRPAGRRGLVRPARSRKPLARTREYVEIIRQVLRREKPVTSDGRVLPAALPGPGRAPASASRCKRSLHPLRADLPIILGAEGPRTWR